MPTPRTKRATCLSSCAAAAVACLALLAQPAASGARPLSSQLPAQGAPGARDECAGKRLFVAPLSSNLSVWGGKDPKWTPFGMVDGFLKNASSESFLELSYLLDYVNQTQAAAVPQYAARIQRFRARLRQIQWRQPADTPLFFWNRQMELMEVLMSRSRRFQCLTQDWREAEAVLVPFDTGLQNRPKELAPVYWAWFLSELTRHPAWQRRQGRDHFVVAGAPAWFCYVQLAVPNVTLVTVEANSQTPRSFSAPYLTMFHPKNQSVVDSWTGFLLQQERPFLMTLSASPKLPYVAGTKVRRIVHWQCNTSSECTNFLRSRSNDKMTAGLAKGPAHLAMYMASVFCLQPRGDTCTRNALLDSIIMGCIPVVFEDCSLKDQWRGQLPPNDPPFYVHIPIETLQQPPGMEKELMTACEGPLQPRARWPINQMGKTGYGGRNCLEHNVTSMDEAHLVRIEDVLKAIPQQQVKAMQRRVMEVLPRVTYGGAYGPGGTYTAPDYEDAFDLLIRGLGERARQGDREAEQLRGAELARQAAEAAHAPVALESGQEAHPPMTGTYNVSTKPKEDGTGKGNEVGMVERFQEELA